jgi:hypothetical protein
MNAARAILALTLSVTVSLPGAAVANSLRAKGAAAQVAGSALSVTPPRDWNRLSMRPGKRSETWTLDGEQLNDVTFYAGIEPDQPLVRERKKKSDPLPRFTATTLLAEVPELLERTYRTVRGTGSFTTTGVSPEPFLGSTGVRFTYEYADDDNLTRKGEGRAALIGGKLYMATFDAPRLHYYDRSLPDFRALADSAKLGKVAGK